MCIHECARICIHILACTHMNVWTYKHTHTDVCNNVYAYRYVNVYIYIYIYISEHAFATTKIYSIPIQTSNSRKLHQPIYMSSVQKTCMFIHVYTAQSASYILLLRWCPCWCWRRCWATISPVTSRCPGDPGARGRSAAM